MSVGWRWREDWPLIAMLSAMAACVVAPICCRIHEANGPRLPSDPRRTLEVSGFAGIEFHGPALAECPADAAEAHRFTAVRANKAVSGVVCCWPGELGDPCRVRFGLGTRGGER